jgi:Nucleotide-diphospho-sugar transferase
MRFITFTSGNYTDMVKNFIINFKNVLAPCGHTLSIVCIDLQAGENLRGEKYDWLYLDVRNLCSINEIGAYNSPSFNHIVSYKPKFVLEYLLNHEEVYYVDSDIVFYSNPEPIIRDIGGCIIFQQDQEFDEHRLCAGNFYVKNTPESIEFMETWIKEISIKPWIVDQNTLNDIVYNKRVNLSVYIFPPQKFQRGLDALDVGSPFTGNDPRGKGWWRLDGKVCIHINFVLGAMHGKIAALKSIGAWFI